MATGEEPNPDDDAGVSLGSGPSGEPSGKTAARESAEPEDPARLCLGSWTPETGRRRVLLKASGRWCHLLRSNSSLVHNPP